MKQSTLFGADSALASTLAGFQVRPQQQEMADAIAHALQWDHPLVVEAGTGTGKTLAYLVPAIASGKRIVVSTGTKTLQDQILTKDADVVRKLFSHTVNIVSLKGISNYLCRRKIANFAKAPLLPGIASQLPDIAAIAQGSRTGDVAELPEGMLTLSHEYTPTHATRLGRRCPHYEDCFVTAARRRAEQADIIVVNHHLFFSDLSLRTRHPGAKLLPTYDAVVFDEAHQLESIMTQHFGVRVSQSGIHRLYGDIANWAQRNRAPLEILDIERCQGAQSDFFNAVQRQVFARGNDERVRIAHDEILRSEAQDLWFSWDSELDRIAQHVENWTDRENIEAREEGEGLRARIHHLRDDVAAVAEASRPNFVFWAERNRHQGLSLAGSPIEVDHVFREHVFPETQATIFTSATLTTEGNFSYFRTRLGLDELAEEVPLDTPFDYESQCLLYIARDVPDPRTHYQAEDYFKTLAQRVVELLSVTNGNAFVLFTSRKALETVHGMLVGKLPYPVLKQGEDTNIKLIESFRATPNSVLFATGAFWEGVDVPGEALSLVILDKLPFASPSDPLVQARMQAIEEREGDAFHELQLPQAALALKQGFGRLIRARSDRGVVAVLDPRLVNRRYGQAFIRTLPTVRRTSSIEQVRRWWVEPPNTEPPG